MTRMCLRRRLTIAAREESDRSHQSLLEPQPMGDRLVSHNPFDLEWSPIVAAPMCSSDRQAVEVETWVVRRKRSVPDLTDQESSLK